MSPVSLLNKDEYQSADPHQNRIEAIWYYVKGSRPSACRRQKLGSVWNQPLSHGAEHIQKGCRSPGRHTEITADFFGDRSGHNDSNRIIGRTHIYQQGQSGNPQFPAFFAADSFSYKRQYKIYSHIL